MNLQGTFNLYLALWDTHGCLPDSAATLYPRPRTSARSSPSRASARGRIGSGTLGSCAMRSPEISPGAILPIAAPPRLKFQNSSPGSLGFSLRGSGLECQAGALRLEPLGDVANFCKCSGLDEPLQTATRTWIFLFLNPYPPTLFTISARPLAARVSARVRPMPKLGGGYYCLNPSPDLPLEFRRSVAAGMPFGRGRDVRAGLRVPRSTRKGPACRSGRRCIMTPVSLLLWVC